MVSFAGVQNLMAKPEHILPYLNRIYQRNILTNTGIKVLEQDWDNLIILDACRYDLFEETADFNGNLSRVISAGSHTSEFLKKNITETHSDTVYLSATPQIQNHGKADNFHRTIHLWDERWDEQLGTVPPAETVRAAIKASKRYDNKRLVVHFIQPHYPFIGPTGKQISHKTVSKGPHDDEEESIWNLLRKGEVDKKTVWKAYRENLEVALPYVEELVEELNGKTVITSDHGNSLGEWGVYGHPPRLYNQSLVEVPWLVIEGNSRRAISQSQVDEGADNKRTEIVESKLEQLGYL